MVFIHERGAGSGDIAIPEPEIERTSPFPEIDAAVDHVAARAAGWVGVSAEARAELLERMIADTRAVAVEWVQADCDRKHLAFDSRAAAEEWGSGPVCVLRNLRLLRGTLEDVGRIGTPRPPGGVRRDRSGRAMFRVVPTDAYDRLLFMGTTADVWMPEGVSVDEAAAGLGLVYRAGAERRPVVGAVLGAGNLSSIPVTDVLYKMFAEDQVVILKLNPITASMGPVFARALAALVEPGYLRIVYGGAAEASHLIHHAKVDAVHLTGSDKTHDAIVFGTGDDGQKRKRENRPLLEKPVTAELGDVTPVIVVPGPWSRRDIAFQAELLATMLVHGGSYECIAGRLLIMQRDWAGREQLLDAMRRVLRRLPNRYPFYPGAPDRFEAFVRAHPEAELLGEGDEDTLPWALIPDVDPGGWDDMVFTTDPFTSVVSETWVEAKSPAAFVDRAVALCNEQVWGSLAAAMLVHPASLKDSDTAAAIERAIRGLRYGTIGVNTGPLLAFGLMSPPWGAFPGHPLDDIQSGRGVVHNTYLIDGPEKTVLRSPFRLRPDYLARATRPWSVTHKRGREAIRSLAYLSAGPTPAGLLDLLRHAIRG